MGLDITALREVTYQGNDGSRDEEMYEKGYEYAWVNRDFAVRSDGRDTGYYSYEDRLSFRAGSYSGYNDWRDQLAHMAHGVSAEHMWRYADEFRDKPFFELINFSDAEGIIGSGPAKRLAEAFAQYDDLAREQGQDFYFAYNVWRRAFEMAANDGLVLFH